MRRLLFLLWLILLWLAAPLASGPALADTVAECAGLKTNVTGVKLIAGSGRHTADYVELGDAIRLSVDGLGALRRCAAASNRPLVLYLDGMPLHEVAEYPPSDPAGNAIAFTLLLKPRDRAVWTALLGQPAPGATYPVPVSVGLSDGYAVPAAPAAEIALRPLPPLGFGLWAVAFVAIAVGFCVFVARSNILRGGTPSGGRIFSLSRSQGAWWFFIVLASYLLIGLTTGDYANGLNGTALTLLGISAATFLGGAAVDASKNDREYAAERRDATVRLDQHLVALRAAPAPDDARIVATEQALGKLRGESRGWLIDVLSDADGIDFHRFQMLAWTFVLGMVFLWEVWQRLAMPDFNATLLGLQGLSAATFVGLKIPEATTPQPP